MTASPAAYAEPVIAASSAADPVLWSCVAGIALVDAWAIWRVGWTVDWRQVGSLAFAIGALGGVGRFAHWRGMRAIGRVTDAVATLLACAVLAQATTYLATLTGAPLRDALYTSMDAAIGFHWGGFARWVAGHAWLTWLCGQTYALLLPQSLAAAIVLAGWYPNRSRAYLRAYGLAFLITVAVWIVGPALGPFPSGPSGVVTAALRSGALHHLNLYAPVGIISMPSFHAAGAVLVAIALWPVPRLRWAAVAFDAVMVVATVPMGGHYLVDVIAGVLLGATAWCWQRSARA